MSIYIMKQTWNSRVRDYPADTTRVRVLSQLGSDDEDQTKLIILKHHHNTGQHCEC